jgi:Leucine-rich repeat (LRR) protein
MRFKGTCVQRDPRWDTLDISRPDRVLFMAKDRTNLWDIYREFKALVQISLDGCNLQEVPSPLFALKSLKILNLENNEIKVFENPNNYVLDSLEELSLTRNQLSGTSL